MNGVADTAEIRTQVEARFGSDGAEAFDTLVAATNPSKAEATHKYAHDLDMSDEIVTMIRSENWISIASGSREEHPGRTG